MCSSDLNEKDQQDENESKMELLSDLELMEFDIEKSEMHHKKGNWKQTIIQIIMMTTK